VWFVVQRVDDLASIDHVDPVWSLQPVGKTFGLMDRWFG
jgi:hypothetical protein